MHQNPALLVQVIYYLWWPVCGDSICLESLWLSEARMQALDLFQGWAVD